MIECHIDLESRSAVDLKKTGVYVYAEDESTDVWCAAYAFGTGPVQIWTPGQPCPPEIAEHVRNGGVFWGHNSNFEMTMWAGVLGPRYGWPVPAIEQWRCTMAMALAMSLPGALENAAAALGLDVQKDKEGHALMMRMARPRKQAPDGSYIWWDDEDRKQRLYAYCKTDVEVERELEKRLLGLRPFEQRLWHLDQTINRRGVFVDLALCDAAKKVVKTTTEKLNVEMAKTTDYAVRACSNAGQLCEWLRKNGLDAVESIAKDQILELLKREDLTPAVRRALELRQEAAKASVAKIEALVLGRSRDGRAKGLLQYHAASTGRWGGRRYQPQNLPRGTTGDVDTAIEDILTGNADLVEMLHGPPLTVVSSCLRGMIAAPPGRKIMAADFSNIEGRVIAWLSGEDWKVKAFREFDAGHGPDLYKLAYARSFGIRPEDVTKEQRQIGKVMELALGYQGGVGAFQTMAKGYGVKVEDKEADRLKVAWRTAHPRIKQFWYDLEATAIEAVERPGVLLLAGWGHIAFRKVGSFLFMRLPSGRAICYPYPRVEERGVPWLKKHPTWVACDSIEGARFLYGPDMVRYDEKAQRALVYENDTKKTLIYKGVDVYTRKWGDIQTYGGELANNAVQGAARDILAEAVVRLEDAGYAVILTVHDEVVSEVDEGFGSLDEFQEIMTTLPAWADGLPIAAGGFEARRYRK